MKYIVLLMALFCTGRLYAQTFSDSQQTKNTLTRSQKDSLKKMPCKINRSAAFLKLGFNSGLVNFDNNTSRIIFQSGLGLGADATLGFKVHKNFALGFGGNYTSYRLNKKLLDQSIDNFFSEYDYNVIDTSDKAGRMSRTSVYLYASYWLYRPKYVLEFYTKLCFGYTRLQLSNIVYRHKVFSKYSEYFVLNKKNTYAGFLPMAGISYSKALSRLVYIYLTAEYGYYFNNFNMLQGNHYSSDGAEEVYNLNVPKAEHIFQANIGVMLRPFNKIKAHEKEYNQEMSDKINTKNN